MKKKTTPKSERRFVDTKDTKGKSARSKAPGPKKIKLPAKPIFSVTFDMPVLAEFLRILGLEETKRRVLRDLINAYKEAEKEAWRNNDNAEELG